MRYVAFLRAINVGGHVVKMDRLRALFETIPLANVSTFIASGNVLFDSKRPPEVLERAIEKKLKTALGYDVAAMVRSAGEVSAVVEYVERHGMGPSSTVTLYVGFLKTAPLGEAARSVAALSTDQDTLSVSGRELYWRCCTSFSQSTIVGANLEKLLNIPATFRNFSTVRKLSDRLS